MEFKDRVALIADLGSIEGYLEGLTNLVDADEIKKESLLLSLKKVTEKSRKLRVAVQELLRPKP